MTGTPAGAAPGPLRSTAPDPAPLRAWLEPGYDGGRVGAWALDVPGVFGSARDREAAITAVRTAAGRARAWLEARGDDPGLPPITRVEIDGEVTARREPDGYEVNATFPSDRRPIAPDELETTLRRLGWLHDDLVARLAAIAAHEAASGPLPTDAAAGERSPDAVVRHLAGAEAWLTGRLDPALRFPGRLDGPAADVLAATLAWTGESLHELAPGDAGAEVADRHGETWTMAKVGRRLVYHAFDHLWELEGRLGRADGTGPRVEVSLDRRPAGPELAALLRMVGWDMRARDPSRLDRAITGSPEVASARDGDRLVGSARSLTDGAHNAYLTMVVVDPRYQGLGVGERLLRALMDGRDDIRFALAAAPGMEAWYAKLGFVPDPRAMYRPRHRR